MSWFHSLRFINLTISRPSTLSSNDCLVCHRLPASTPVFIVVNRRLQNSSRFHATFARRGCRDTAFMDSRTSTSLPSCRRLHRRLPSGASLCALKDGKSVDSTLGFTALDGLCMGTRPGTLDPGVVLHLFQGLHMS